MKPVLYIAGPYSPIPGSSIARNIAVARDAAISAWLKGWAAICPHLNTCHFEEACSLPNEAYYEGDLAFITRMQPDRGDALLFLPQWQESVGAQFEHDYAREIGLPCYYAEEGLPPAGAHLAAIRKGGGS